MMKLKPILIELEYVDKIYYFTVISNYYSIGDVKWKIKSSLQANCEGIKL
jgi:hypothetical protein